LGDISQQLRADISRYLPAGGPGVLVPPSAALRVFFTEPRLFAVALHRYGSWVEKRFRLRRTHPVRYICRFLYYLGSLLSVTFLKIQIREATVIGPGLYLSNGGYIIIGADRLGRGCTIDHDVTIGHGPDGKAPDIGDGVRIGHNSVVYGQIRIGNGVEIEADSVVARSVPDFRLVGGNPARMRRDSAITAAP
jgi:serine O-acetyltransferase